MRREDVMETSFVQFYVFLAIGMVAMAPFAL